MIVTVDVHEDQEIRDALGKQCQINSQVCAGSGLLDYTWADHAGTICTVERKTVQDLSGRVDDLERQLKEAMQVGLAGHISLLIEGVMAPASENSTTLYQRGRKSDVFFAHRSTPRPYTYYMSFVLSVAEFGIPTFWTADKDATAKLLLLMIVKSQNPTFTTFNRYIRKHTIPDLDPQVQTLVNIGIGPGRAMALIGKYKNVHSLIKALENPKEIVSLEGVGMSTVNLLKEKIGWA